RERGRYRRGPAEGSRAGRQHRILPNRANLDRDRDLGDRTEYHRARRHGRGRARRDLRPRALGDLDRRARSGARYYRSRGRHARRVFHARQPRTRAPRGATPGRPTGRHVEAGTRYDGHHAKVGAMNSLELGGGWSVEWAVADRALQEESGDLHVVAPFDGGVVVAVIDGLGHGPEAAHAARGAATVVTANAGAPLDSLLRGCHDALHHTRGVAMS